MYTSAWKIRSRNNSLEREWPKRSKERERGGGRGVLNTHTHFFGYLCWFAWTDLNPGQKYLEKTKISNRLKSWMWNLWKERWCDWTESTGKSTNLEYKQTLNTQILNTQILNYKCIYLPLFLNTITNHARVCVCEICWDDRINIVYLKLEILVFYSAFLCFYHVFSFGSSCTMSTLYRFHVFYRRIRRGER